MARMQEKQNKYEAAKARIFGRDVNTAACPSFSSPDRDCTSSLRRQSFAATHASSTNLGARRPGGIAPTVMVVSATRSSAGQHSINTAPVDPDAPLAVGASINSSRRRAEARSTLANGVRAECRVNQPAPPFTLLDQSCGSGRSRLRSILRSVPSLRNRAAPRL